MKKMTTVIAAIVLMSLSLGSAPQEGLQLFQKALAMERGEGNLEGAIALYQRIVRETQAEDLAAKAQLRIGICYEKLGKAEAQKAYQLVIEKYPAQTAQVAEARSRIAELTAKTPARDSLKHIYSWRKENFYMEALSLSPDGSKLLGIDISSGQNVAYKDLINGKFVNITQFDWESEGHGWTYNPVWSPGGKEVAFNYRGWKNSVMELRIADLKGNTRTIYRCDARKNVIYPLDWFPDGLSILAMHITSENQLQLGSVSVQGGEFKLIYEPDVPTDGNFNPNARQHIQTDLSPDGKYIAFHKAEGKVKNLYVMDLSTKKVKTLTASPANDIYPQWSPDGKYIAFLSDRLGSKALWAISMDKDGHSRGQPFLMRDGMEHTERLANWTEQGITYSKFVELQDIYTMKIDPQSGAPKDKPKQLNFRPTGNNWHPVYSPNGKYLVFIMNPEEEPPARNIIVYSVAGGEAQSFRVPSKNFWAALNDLCWLPDSSGISFSGQTSSETPGWKEGMKPFRLFQLDLDTEDWRTWDLGGKAWHRSAWRGDGQGFYYTRMRVIPGNWDIMERDIRTGEERVLFKKGTPFLRCSRDYTKLVSGSNGFKIIDVKSGETLKEFNNFGVPYVIPAWSPDGRFLMTRSRDKDTAYTVISYADGVNREYDLSESLTDGEMRFLDWSPMGNQMAFGFRFRQFDAYLISNVISEDIK